MSNLVKAIVTPLEVDLKETCELFCRVSKIVLYPKKSCLALSYCAVAALLKTGRIVQIKKYNKKLL